MLGEVSVTGHDCSLDEPVSARCSIIVSETNATFRIEEALSEETSGLASPRCGAGYARP